MIYNSFIISDNAFGLKTIIRNGKQIFTARHQVCFSEEEAKQLIDESERMKQIKPVEKKLYAQTAYERFQLSRYGNVIPEGEVQEEMMEPQVVHGEYFVWSGKNE